MVRALTDEEARILERIQAHYGPQYSEDSITWMNGDRATMWVTDGTGEAVLIAHLTNLALWCVDGTITSDRELRRDWPQKEDALQAAPEDGHAGRR